MQATDQKLPWQIKRRGCAYSQAREPSTLLGATGVTRARLEPRPNGRACQMWTEIELLCVASSTLRARPSSFLQLTPPWASCRSFSNPSPSHTTSVARFHLTPVILFGPDIVCFALLKITLPIALVPRCPHLERVLHIPFVDSQSRLNYDLTLLTPTPGAEPVTRAPHAVTSTIPETSPFGNIISRPHWKAV